MRAGPTPRPTGARPAERPISLRHRSRAIFGATLVLAIVAVVLGAVTVQGVLDARSRLLDHVDPAAVEAERFLASLVDQETGVRAYVIVEEQRFLEPYTRGAEAQEASAARLTELLEGDEDLEPALGEVLAAADGWRQAYAEPTLASVRAGEATANLPEALEEGRRLFERVRASVEALEGELDDRRRDARADLDRSTNALVITLVGASALMVAAVGSLWLLLRRSVKAPLAELSYHANRVAEGDVDHEIAEIGPTELRELAQAMEARRARIVAELRASDAARGELLERTEELGRSNAELEQFAYVASHDLQEPLRKVASFCQLLQSRYGGQLDERADQYIGFAVDGAKRMQRLINDLLAFSRVGRLSGPMAPVPLGEVRDQALDALDDVIAEAGATVESDELPVVLGERALLAALFQNLIGNAVKYRRADVAPRIRITVRTSGDSHELAVDDNGIGIEPEYAERVFVIFQRLHSKEQYEGTGIGLALCRKIVEHHGGRIWVDPDVEEGTTVRLTLPALAGAGPEAGDGADGAEGGDDSGAPDEADGERPVFAADR